MEEGIKRVDMFSNSILQVDLEHTPSSDAASNMLLRGTGTSLKFRGAVLHEPGQRAGDVVTGFHDGRLIREELSQVVLLTHQ